MQRKRCMPPLVAALLALSLLLPCVRATAAAAASAPVVKAKLTLDDLFPHKSMWGKVARDMAWSPDDRYVAYRWNPYDVRGWDLWIYDTREHKSRQVTTIDLMAGFDRDLKPIIERYSKDRQEDARRAKLTVEERRKLEDEDDEKERNRKEAMKEYEGISGFQWANHANELLFVYRGDVFRYVVGQDVPTRITRTREAESDVRYTKDDRGFYFRRGDGLFRVRFDSAEVEQIDPALPNGLSMSDYRLSPDKTKILIVAWRPTGKPREVSYLSYRARFAEAKTTERSTADDPFLGETYLYLYDMNDDPKKNPQHDGKPWEIYHWPQSTDYGGPTISEQPWSADSQRVVFSTYKRSTRQIEVAVADFAQKKVTTVYRDIHNGEHTTPGMADPVFTPDGKRIVTLLEKSGFRHAWTIDPAKAVATQLTHGDFEVYLLKLSDDGKNLLVTSTKENSARLDLYRVDMADGSMHRLTSDAGSYSDIAPDHKQRRFAAAFRSWHTLPEMIIGDGSGQEREVAVTSSHAPGTLEKVTRLSAELFEFKNRHDQIVHGCLIRPRWWKKTDRRPLLVYTYGGPLGTGKQVSDGAYSGDGYLFPLYMALKYGFVCATIDPRGSSGYGAAFGAANWENPGKPEVEDLSDGVKYLVENSGVDPVHVAIHGWSFGGFQTQMCMYTAPDVFSLGIAGAGPTEWQNYNNWYSGGVIGPTPQGSPEALDKFSLTHLAKNLRSPLMLLHGMEDTNVLFQDTVKVYRELLHAGKAPLVELVPDPTGGHGLGGDIRSRQRFEIYESFIVRRWGL